ncbi:hypothetical protein [Sphingobium sp. CCH11-B1]|uniref:hypothetical protein n=1 Tax=Sphingobium sp. CCH11-B1 TaxID=1768781 RepID=UPI00082C7CD6|nr:hypothetical protein [Sphingobium sp. CCH11-B1]
MDMKAIQGTPEYRAAADRAYQRNNVAYRRVMARIEAKRTKLEDRQAAERRAFNQWADDQLQAHREAMQAAEAKEWPKLMKKLGLDQ